MGNCWCRHVIFLFVTVKWYQMKYLTVLGSNIMLLPGSFSFVMYFSSPFTMHTQEGWIHGVFKALWKTSSTKNYVSMSLVSFGLILSFFLYSKFHKLVATGD